MFGVEQLSINTPGAPLTSFPKTLSPSQPAQQSFGELLQTLDPILILSDPHECNKNISVFLKSITDFLSHEDEVYHKGSIISLKLLNSNLFVKNYKLCLGKVLSIVKLLTEANSCSQDAFTLTQVLSIILLVFFKLFDDKESKLYTVVDNKQLLDLLRELSFVEVMASFISSQVETSQDAGFSPNESSHSNYVLLKLNCDIFFNYLYHSILLSKEEFTSLTECTLIPNLIDHLISNTNFNNYNLSNDDFNDTNKLIAYEEFKLLLLVNEQYMMRTYTANDSLQNNKVIDGLMCVNGIPGFINLLAYHMNREESHIIKILMLKFLYSIMSSTYYCKLCYLNDLKILVDIFVRELNDLDYSEKSQASHGTDRFLALTYLKTLHHLLVQSQLNDISPKYKPEELIELLSNVILNCDESESAAASQNTISINSNSLVKAALKCLNISWLKKSSKVRHKPHVSVFSQENGSTDSIVSGNSTSSRVVSLKNSASDITASNDSFSFTRVASVKANSRSDYNQHTRSHNKELVENVLDDLDDQLTLPCNIFEENNSNVFMANRTRPSCLSSRQTLGLLDLPKEYLASKSLPSLPQDVSAGQSRLKEKARQKKAPAPPPPPPRRRR